MAYPIYLNLLPPALARNKNMGQTENNNHLRSNMRILPRQPSTSFATATPSHIPTPITAPYISVIESANGVISTSGSVTLSQNVGTGIPSTPSTYQNESKARTISLAVGVPLLAIVLVALVVYWVMRVPRNRGSKRLNSWDSVLSRMEEATGNNNVPQIANLTTTSSHSTTLGTIEAFHGEGGKVCAHYCTHHTPKTAGGAADKGKGKEKNVILDYHVSVHELASTRSNSSKQIHHTQSGRHQREGVLSNLDEICRLDDGDDPEQIQPVPAIQGSVDNSDAPSGATKA